MADGSAAVQDEASQLAAVALAGAALTGPDRLWLDLCAGPGGKASLLGGIAAARGARLVAADIQPHRAALARASMAGRAAGGVPRVAAAAGSAGRIIVADGTSPPWRPGAFDRVLADVPCSGLGALRRRPEARWRRTPRDVAGLGALQRALLTAALMSVRPGGVVAYVTCSPHVDETRRVVEDVTAAAAGAGAVPAARARRRRARRARGARRGAGPQRVPARRGRAAQPEKPRRRGGSRAWPLRAVLAAPARNRCHLRCPAPPRRVSTGPIELREGTGTAQAGFDRVGDDNYREVLLLRLRSGDEVALVGAPGHSPRWRRSRGPRRR